MVTERFWCLSGKDWIKISLEVNLFDTGRAARVLGYESFGLAYLLKRFCNVIANKEYQRADWR